jgi:hypothetical protein
VLGARRGQLLNLEPIHGHVQRQRFGPPIRQHPADLLFEHRTRRKTPNLKLCNVPERTFRRHIAHVTSLDWRRNFLLNPTAGRLFADRMEFDHLVAEIRRVRSLELPACQPALLPDSSRVANRLDRLALAQIEADPITVRRRTVEVRLQIVVKDFVAIVALVFFLLPALRAACPKT